MDYLQISELYHHGIKGQKWGVRRFQNEDGSLTEAGRLRIKGAKRKTDLAKTQLGVDLNQKNIMKPDKDASKSLELKKGSNVYHVTPKDFKALNPDQDLFVSATEYDRNLYKSMLTMQMRKKGFGVDTPISEVSFKLKEDLKSPSNDEQKKIFLSAYNKNKKVFDDDMKKYYSNEKMNSSELYDKFIKTLDKPSISKQIFYKEIKKNGFNAVLDQHDVDNSWMQASRPLIVMEAMNVLGDIKVSKITDSDIKESLKKLNYI